jgi:toxin ParE1/3/4
MEPVDDEPRPERITRKILVRRRAELDIVEAFIWYQEQLDGLGFEFLQLLDETVQLVDRFPASNPIIFQNIRRALLRRFPYAVFYLLEEDTLIILACLHQKQQRENWLSDSADD